MIDWRNPKAVDKLRYEATVLSDNTAYFCLSMMKHLNLEFGAFDFAVDKFGDPVFLEINPNGQWYWLEYFCKLPISQSISEALTN